MKAHPGKEGLKPPPMIGEREGLGFTPIGKQDLGDVFVLRNIDAHDHLMIVDGSIYT